MFIDGYPTHFSYAGEFQEVVKWLGLGQRLVQWCIQNGTPARDIYPASGVRISATCMEGIAALRIEASGGYLINGLADLRLDSNVPGSTTTWSVNKKQGMANVVERVKTGFSPLQRETKLVSNFYNKANTYAQARDYIQSSGANTGLYDVALNDSPLVKMPGRFTGEMRKVVQLLVGMGQPVPYEFDFNRSHGIWTAPNGRRWVIEVGLRGIYAAKLPYQQTLNSSAAMESFSRKWNTVGYDLPYVPKTNNPIPVNDAELVVAISARRVLELASFGVLSEFYSNLSFFDACGWAFSSSGRLIKNTCWAESTDPNPSLDWRTGKLYSIELACNDGINPVFNGIMLEESGWLHGDRVCHFKMPRSTSEADGLYSFDLYHGNGNKPTVPYTAPFYVFFDGETPVVCRYSSGSGSQSTAVNTGAPPAGWKSILYPGSANSDSALYQLGTQTTTFPPYVYASTFSDYSGSYGSFSGQQQRDSWTYRPQAWVSDFSGVIDQNGAECAKISMDYLNGVEDIDRSTYVAVVPFHDREAVYFYKIRESIRRSTGVQRTSYINYAVYRPGVPIYEVNGRGIVDTYFGTGYVLMTPTTLQFGTVGYAYTPNGYPLPAGVHYNYNDTIPVTSDTADSGDQTLAADNTSAATEGLVLVASAGLAGGLLVLSGDCLGKYPIGGNPYLLYLTDNLAPQFMHVVPDAFSSGRLISTVFGAPSVADYCVTGVFAEYVPAYQQPNFSRFFFGVP